MPTDKLSRQFYVCDYKDTIVVNKYLLKEVTQNCCFLYRYTNIDCSFDRVTITYGYTLCIKSNTVIQPDIKDYHVRIITDPLNGHVGPTEYKIEQHDNTSDIIKSVNTKLGIDAKDNLDKYFVTLELLN